MGVSLTFVLGLIAIAVLYGSWHLAKSDRVGDWLPLATWACLLALMSTAGAFSWSQEMYVSRGGLAVLSTSPVLLTGPALWRFDKSPEFTVWAALILWLVPLVTSLALTWLLLYFGNA